MGRLFTVLHNRSVERISQMGKELAERDRKLSLLSKAECRYLYDKMTIDEICDQLGLEGREVREYFLTRKDVLRFRWHLPCSHAQFRLPYCSHSE